MREIQIEELEEFKKTFGSGYININPEYEKFYIEIDGQITIIFKPTHGTKIELDVFKGMEKIEFVISELPPAVLEFKLPFFYPNENPIFEIKCFWLTDEQKCEIIEDLKKTCIKCKKQPIMLSACYRKFKLIVESWNLTKIQGFFEKFQEDFPFHSYDDFVEVLIKERDHLKNNTALLREVNCFVCCAVVSVNNLLIFQPCNHYFCKKCVQFCYRSIVMRSLVRPLKCLMNDCSSEMSEVLIKEILGNDLYKKYGELRLEKAILMDRNWVRCLNQNCDKYACIIPNLNKIQCAYCKFELCTNCQQTYHGSSECVFTLTEKITMVEMWQSGAKEDKIKMCKENGGSARVEKLIENFKSEIWVLMNAKPCPSCGAKIEKDGGCNSITCSRCRCEFCWLCFQMLSTNIDYSIHFSTGNCAGRSLPEGRDNDIFVIKELNEQNH